MTVFSPGAWIQLDETSLLPIFEQMLPRVHAENVCSESDVVGFMMNLPPASQLDEDDGQH